MWLLRVQEMIIFSRLKDPTDRVMLTIQKGLEKFTVVPGTFCDRQRLTNSENRERQKQHCAAQTQPLFVIPPLSVPLVSLLICLWGNENSLITRAHTHTHTHTRTTHTHTHTHTHTVTEARGLNRKMAQPQHYLSIPISRQTVRQTDRHTDRDMDKYKC